MPGPTKYRLTWEFTLKSPSDYTYFRHAIERKLEGMCDVDPDIQGDYLAIEKVEPGNDPS